MKEVYPRYISSLAKWITSVQNAVGQMQQTDDILSVLNRMRDMLEEMDIDYCMLGVNAIDPQASVITQRYWVERSNPKQWHFQVTEKVRVAYDCVVDFWRSGDVAYRRDLTAEDRYGERPWAESLNPPIRSVIDIPFAGGTLAISSCQAEAFSDDHIVVLQILAGALAAGFQRLRDLELLSQRNAELEREIAERQRSEAEVRANAAMFEKWKNSNFIGIIQSSASGDIIDANDTLLNMLGYSREDLAAGKLDWTQLTPEEFLPLDEQAIEEAKAKGYWTPFEKEYFHRDGHRVPILIGGSLYQEESEHFIVFILDLSERRRMEEDLRKIHNLESLGILAGGIAHDFNNLLTGITGSLDMLNRSAADNSSERSLIGTALSAAEHAAGLAQQLLTFAKGGEPVKETVSLAPVLQDAITRSLHGSNAKTEFDLAQDAWDVEIDKGQMAQVFQNIAINANQAMPAGGTLHIALSNASLPAENDFHLEAGNYVKVSIEDEGIGMSAETMAKIFDPYYTTKPTGHGLGLSTSYSIVHRHGGHLSVRSEPDAGTAFNIYLPVATKRLQPVRTEEKHTPDADIGSGRILLMDDEPLIHETVGKMLQLLNYQVESVYDGLAAIDAYQTALNEGAPYDLVFMDLTIPGGMGGKEAIGQLLDVDPQARAVVFSGYSNDPVMANCTSYGFAAAVEKPVSMARLASIVQEAQA